MPIAGIVVALNLRRFMWLEMDMLSCLGVKVSLGCRNSGRRIWQLSSWQLKLFYIRGGTIAEMRKYPAGFETTYATSTKKTGSPIK